MAKTKTTTNVSTDHQAKVSEALRQALGLPLQAMVSHGEVIARMQSLKDAAGDPVGPNLKIAQAAKAVADKAQATVDHSTETIEALDAEIAASEEKLEEANGRLRVFMRKNAVSTGDVVKAENQRRLVARLNGEIAKSRSRRALAERQHETLQEHAYRVQRNERRLRLEADAERLMRLFARMNNEFEAALTAHADLLGDASYTEQNGRIVAPVTLVGQGRGDTALERAGDVLRHRASNPHLIREITASESEEERAEPLAIEVPTTAELKDAFPEDYAKPVASERRRRAAERQRKLDEHTLRDMDRDDQALEEN